MSRCQCALSLAEWARTTTSSSSSITNRIDCTYRTGVLVCTGTVTDCRRPSPLADPQADDPSCRAAGPRPGSLRLRLRLQVEVVLLPPRRQPLAVHSDLPGQLDVHVQARAASGALLVLTNSLRWRYKATLCSGSGASERIARVVLLSVSNSNVQVGSTCHPVRVSGDSKERDEKQSCASPSSAGVRLERPTTSDSVEPPLGRCQRYRRSAKVRTHDLFSSAALSGSVPVSQRTG